MKSNKQVKNKSKTFRKMKGGYDEDDDFFEDLFDFLVYAENTRNDQSSILHIAACGHESMVEVLLDTNRSEKLQKFLIPFHVGEVEIDAKDSGNNTPLNYACREGYMRIAKLLLDRGANVNNRGYMGSTPLHRLFEKSVEGRSTFPVKYANYFYTCAKFLIDKGADVNAMDDYGSTPLHKHCMHRHMGVFYLVKALLEHGADVNARNVDGETPLHISCNNIKTMNQTRVAEFLISKGADINVKDYQNKTPFEYIKDPNIREWFEKLKDRKDAKARVLNSIKTNEGENRRLLPPNVLDNISDFIPMDVSRPLTDQQLKRSQDGRDKRDSLRRLNEKKADGKLLPSEILDNIRKYVDPKKAEKIKENRNKVKKGGKHKTKKNKNSKRKTRKH